MDNLKDATSLDSLLDGSAPEQAKVEAAQPPELEAQPAPIETGEKDQHLTPPADAKANPGQDADGPLVPRKALEDERRKRQSRDKEFEDLQRQFAAMQAQLQPQPQQPPQPQDAPPDPWIDPQGAFEYQQRQFQQQLYETRLFTSEEIVRAQVPDYDDLVSVFIQEAKSVPGLQRQLVSHPFPAKFVVDVARKIKLIKEVGSDPEAYKKRVIEEWQASQAGETLQSQQQPQKVSVPKSLAGTPSAPARDAKGRFQGPASLDEILGG